MTRLRSVRARVAVMAVIFAALALDGCAGADVGPSSSSSPSPVPAGQTGIRGLATAGPVCPVERVPPDPACAPRPVAGARVVIRDASGTEVATAMTGPDGVFFVELQPGNYVVEPEPVQGLLGTAAQQGVSVGVGSVAVVALDYDTGIR